MATDLEQRVAAYYATTRLAETILNGLAESGVSLDALTLDDLAPVDEFHTGGRATTLKALELMRLEAGMHVLDAGCGIGGTARRLAVEYRCRVTGLDLTDAYIEVAKMLTERMKLSHACQFHRGSATEMPFEDETFDAAVSFHVAMNIERRADLYRELARVLRPRASLCVFDVMKGPAPGMVYPVPWAEEAATSFLRSRDETVDALEDVGFKLAAERNLRTFAQDYFRDAAEGSPRAGGYPPRAGGSPPRAGGYPPRAGGLPPLGLHMLTGSNAPEKFRNYAQALNAHQVAPVILVASKR